ncbi:hypothetical protein ACTZWW_16840 [Salinarimonas sp. NSM]|uniref:hypothetical protein n=1 Tax=Salinarimonas sp. NSM TaxID=3458003 RepID=UPI004036AE99
MVAFVLALILPFVALVMLERYLAACGAFILQATILGWPIATVWALVAQRAADEADRRASEP